MRKPRYSTLLGIFLLWFGCFQKADDIVREEGYFPPSDREGGWRTVTDSFAIKNQFGLDLAVLDEALEDAKVTTKNGGLLVVKDGWLVYEKYFGRGHREALANLASIGKSFTSVSLGILLSEQTDNFPDGLEQKVYTTEYLPVEAFPLHDERKAEIKLGHLLAFTSGIRGNNPCYVNGESIEVNLPGLDGWSGMSDRYALGLKDYESRGNTYTAKTLWTDPEGGYSYATASIHIASIVLRKASGRELEEFVRSRIAEPIGWGRFSFGYQNMPEVDHTPGGGGIVARPTDMLRFGYLLLNHGRWNGDQVIPESYVDHATHRSPYNPHFPYSLQFNINDGGQVSGLPTDAFWKTGSGGHHLLVVPSLDLVVWLIGGRDSQFAANNTGMAPHPDAIANVDERPEWTSPSRTQPERGISILQKVVSAIKK